MLTSTGLNPNESRGVNQPNVSQKIKVPRVNVLEEIITSAAQIVFAGALGALTAWTFSVMPVLAGAVVMASFVTIAMIAKVACALLGISNEVIKGAIGGFSGVLGANLIALKVLPYLGMIVSVPVVTTFVACHLVVGLALAWLFRNQSSSANASSTSNLNSSNSTHSNSLESVSPDVGDIQPLLEEVLSISEAGSNNAFTLAIRSLVQINPQESRTVLEALITMNRSGDNANFSLLMSDAIDFHRAGSSNGWRAQWGRYDH